MAVAPVAVQDLVATEAVGTTEVGEQVEGVVPVAAAMGMERKVAVVMAVVVSVAEVSAVVGQVMVR